MMAVTSSICSSSFSYVLNSVSAARKKILFLFLSPSKKKQSHSRISVSVGSQKTYSAMNHCDVTCG